MIEGKGSASSTGEERTVPDFTDLVCSWSLQDIFNDKLYENQVEVLPKSFNSVGHYFGSYVFPLLEETRAALASSMEIMYSAPFAEVISLSEVRPYGTRSYDIKVDDWKNRFSDRGREPYKTLPGDIFVLTDTKPQLASDLERFGNTWTFASVITITEGENEENCSSTQFKVKASKFFEEKEAAQKSLYVVFLLNITSNKRIWNALHMHGNLQIIKEILCTNSIAEETCTTCFEHHNSHLAERFGMSQLNLNKSQIEAILASLLRLNCDCKPSLELIWGPPGTGKTKTISVMLFILSKMKCRTLTCAPTNVAITEVASRVLQLIEESFIESEGTDLFCPVGDMLLFGNKDRLKVSSDIEEIYLDYRVDRLVECLGPLTGWRHCLNSIIVFLESCVSQYHIFLENESIKAKELINQDGVQEPEFNSFLEFARARFRSYAKPLRSCILIFCTHLPRSFIQEHNFRSMIDLIHLLDSLEELLIEENIVSEELEKLFSQEKIEDSTEPFDQVLSPLYMTRSNCLSVLKILLFSLEELELPSAMNKDSVMKFCFQNASLYFCTASTSYKLHFVGMETLDFLIIDEAAQLKECESTIPLQLPGIKRAVLIGDERQLPAMVNSKMSEAAGFGTSLFERMSLLGHSKRLLNVQYRMHPSISLFPNSYIYNNQILDGSNVLSKSYNRRYLPGPMFGPYAFIDIVGGREEKDDDGRSWRNMVEVALVTKIILKLHKEWRLSTRKINIGVISPYAAQVVAIQEKLGRRYEHNDRFSVKVKSVDGFQGGEEDVIIISTVRSNPCGSVGFMDSLQRANVALTRARHCLWILGNERCLANSGSIWEALVHDASDRQCLFNAADDSDMAKAIITVKKEFDQLDDLLNGNSVLFRSGRWKVLFSDNFRKSFGKLTSSRMKKSVINLLLKLSSGWRPKKRNVDYVCDASSQILKKFKVEGLYVICSVDIIKESRYMQVLKVWDVLSENIPKLERHLDGIFVMYTDDFINRCKERCLEGDLEVPKTWVTTYDIVKFRDPNDESGSNAVECRNYVENSKVSESLLLMKFYPLSSSVVSHLLSDRDNRELDLPFEVTDDERKIILFPRSSFVLGRSGTGKTTVLTMKLYQKEDLHYMVSKGFCTSECSTPMDVEQGSEVGEHSEDTKESVLRQLFVTVSPKLCYAIKQHVSNLKSFACGNKSWARNSDIDAMDDTTRFKDIPDSFVGIPAKKYPLVITFHKFLMMLDGTLGNSYFERFNDLRESHDKSKSSRSVALQTFIRTKEVNYERFFSSYWPRFNTQLIKKLDPSRVFTEIISHIKGGFRATEALDGKLLREIYVSSEARWSSLTRPKREKIYDIFQDYEKMKIERSEFDLADLVNDLHLRLRSHKLEGDKMDFVYIDEVQDLTMSQLALFKYICWNVDEGFVFSGDTAQTIARGIDFRFEDIRSLFYSEFILDSHGDESARRKEKGLLSETFHLTQNFRTHVGVLNLAQSVIELLYRFFPNSVDLLKPETSLIYGETPVFLEPCDDENAIVTIFGNSGSVGGTLVGFGAEQVILVRDDCARKEISGYVGKQALVLTILECKGLEFQDVLLYNFFGSSPLKNQWRVIYEYMKEQDILDTISPNYPTFNEARHNILCSELKQLYVAITRTRQRLWICENTDDISKPMYDYWKRRCLVQVKKLDESLAQAMQVASSAEEWKKRGIKLFHESNYEMATMCFDRAGDTIWEKRARASGLRASADLMRVSNPEVACTVLREAAEIFESIGSAENAAECFYELGEFERAGRIYMEKCGEAELKKAGECFKLAGHYVRAAEVYAKGYYFSDCLSVCTQGKLFDVGLQYIEYWKQHASRGNDMIRNKGIEKMEQEFLESSALNYFELKDNRSMMRFIRAFDSMDSQRKFLKSLNCLDELLMLEEESGNFMEAAEIAKLRGDLILEANLREKAGLIKEASLLILRHVLFSSLWASGNTGWPLNQFPEKVELEAKVKSLAKREADPFYKFVCTEVNILSHEKSDLSDLKQYFEASQQHNSLRGEILSVWKILDAHLCLNTSRYDCKYELPGNMIEHAKEMISHNRVSLGTLICFWNIWKDHIINIFEYLTGLEIQDHSVPVGYGEFCLNYFGVQRQLKNQNFVYIFLNPEADWIRKFNNAIYLQKTGNVASADARHFVSAARNYWCSELLSVGMNVLEIVEVLRKSPAWTQLTVLCQSTTLVDVYEVAKFLLESKFIDCRYHDARRLQDFLELPYDYFENIFPLDWRNSLTEKMVSLRETQVFHSLLEDLISRNVSKRGNATYGQFGRVMSMWLGSRRPNDILCEMILKRFASNTALKAFIQNLCGQVQSEYFQKSKSNNFNENTRDTAKVKDAAASIPAKGEHVFPTCLIFNFHKALEDTWNANWKAFDYISPNGFLYLTDRLLNLVFYSLGSFYTTKSSFIEWLIYQQSNGHPNASIVANAQISQVEVYNFVISIVRMFLDYKQVTVEWIQKSKINFSYYYPLLVMKLIVMLSLLCLNSGEYHRVLLNLLNRYDISSQLPKQFFDVLRRAKKHNFLDMNPCMLAEAFQKIGDPLLIVNFRKKTTNVSVPGAIFVDTESSPCRKDIMRILFPGNDEAPQRHSLTLQADETNSSGGQVSLKRGNSEKISKELSSKNVFMKDENMSRTHKNEATKQMNWEIYWEVSNVLNSEDHQRGNIPARFLSKASEMKVEVGKNVDILTAALSQNFDKPCDGKDGRKFDEAKKMLDELKQLSSAMDTSGEEFGENISSVGELLKRLQSRRPRMENFLNEILPPDNKNFIVETSKTNVLHVSQDDEEVDDKADNVNNSDKAYGQAPQANVNKGNGNSRAKKKKKDKRKKK